MGSFANYFIINVTLLKGPTQPKERKWEMIQAAGQRSMVSLNLNKLMRDLVEVSQQAKTIEA
jgi:hypothetical protein